MLNKIIALLSRILPINKNKISFFDNRFYPDMLFAIISSLYKYPIDKKKMILIVSNKGVEYGKYFKGLVVCKHKSIWGIYHLLTSKIVFTDGYFSQELSERGRILINLWHGVGLKKILNFTEEYQGKNIKFATYTFAYSEYFQKITAQAFGLDQDHVIISGSPRNDLFHLGEREDLDAIRTGITSHSKVIIWMPTYRISSTAVSKNDGKAYEFGIPLVTSENIDNLNSYLKELDVILIIKYHVLQNVNNIFEQTFSNIVIVTSEDIMKTKKSLYQFIGKCDGLITDYSSIYFEYLSLNRPICFAYDDYDEYNNKRGFMFENALSIMPGIQAITFDKLLGFVNEIAMNLDSYKEERERTIKTMQLFTDSNNSKRFIENLNKIIK